MKKNRRRNAITLLALVITIVIMLLLAGVAIQMTMRENGLIAKSAQAQKEQAKAELLEIVKNAFDNSSTLNIELYFSILKLSDKTISGRIISIKSYSILLFLAYCSQRL